MWVNLAFRRAGWGALAWLLVLALESTASAARPTNQVADISPATLADDPLIERHNQFALALLPRLEPTGAANEVYAPISLQAALAMAMAGARGNTQAEMAALLGAEMDPHLLHSHFARLQAELQATSAREQGVRLTVANRLWVDHALPLQAEFQTLLAERYGAACGLLDFRHPDMAAHQVNQWVEHATRGRIPQLVDPQGISGGSLLLTSAFHFAGQWADPFSSQATAPAAFHTPRGDATVPMMRHEGYYGLARGDGFFLIELPYAGGEASLLCLLPETRGMSLARLRGQLTAAQVDAALERSSRCCAQLQLPRFELASRNDLKAPLSALGMRQAFRADADFAGISGSEGLFLGAAIHQAYLRIDEQGTEAAAATALSFALGSSGELKRPPQVRLDRPFLFIVRHQATGQWLLLGQMADPSAAAR